MKKVWKIIGIVLLAVIVIGGIAPELLSNPLYQDQKFDMK